MGSISQNDEEICARTSTIAFPQTVSVSHQYVATNLFMAQYVGGVYMHYALDVCKTASQNDGSPLRHTLDAVSMLDLSLYVGSPVVLNEAMTSYSAALKFLNTHLTSSPVATGLPSHQDMLVCIMMLALFAIKSPAAGVTMQPEQWTQHVQGALSLLQSMSDETRRTIPWKLMGHVIGCALTDALFRKTAAPPFLRKLYPLITPAGPFQQKFWRLIDDLTWLQAGITSNNTLLQDSKDILAWALAIAKRCIAGRAPMPDFTCLPFAEVIGHDISDAQVGQLEPGNLTKFRATLTLHIMEATALQIALDHQCARPVTEDTAQEFNTIERLEKSSTRLLANISWCLNGLKQSQPPTTPDQSRQPVSLPWLQPLLWALTVVIQSSWLQTTPAGMVLVERASSMLAQCKLMAGLSSWAALVLTQQKGVKKKHGSFAGFVHAMYLV